MLESESVLSVNWISYLLGGAAGAGCGAMILRSHDTLDLAWSLLAEREGAGL